MLWPAGAPAAAAPQGADTDDTDAGFYIGEKPGRCYTIEHESSLYGGYSTADEAEAALRQSCAKHLAAQPSAPQGGPDSLSMPEPAPRPTNGPAIWALVITDAERDGLPAEIVADMRQRDAEGRRKYGTPLQAFNGRRPLVDAYQEGLDLVVYLRQAYEESADVGVLVLYREALGLLAGLRSAVGSPPHGERPEPGKHTTPCGGCGKPGHRCTGPALPAYVPKVGDRVEWTVSGVVDRVHPTGPHAWAWVDVGPESDKQGISFGRLRPTSDEPGEAG